MASTRTGPEGAPTRSPRSSVTWKKNPGTVMVAFSVAFSSLIKSPAEAPGRAFCCLVRDRCLQATRRDDADCHLLGTQNGALGGGNIQVHHLLGDDTLFEGDEGFSVTLSNIAGGASLGTPATANVTITEDGPPPAQDSNGDGLSDADAIALGLDPNDPDGDTDNDGISDVLEVGSYVNNPPGCRH